MDTVQVRLTKKQVNELDKLVKYGIYSSRGEAVRDAVRRLELLVTLTELQKKAKEKDITREELLKELEVVKNEANFT